MRLRPPHSGSTTFAEAFAHGASGRRNRLLIGAVVALLALVGLAGVLAWRQYDDAKQQALRDLRARAIIAGAVFDTYFAGQVGTLDAIADSPSVRSGDVHAMNAYFARVQPPRGATFTAGIGWLDRSGIPRASNTPARLNTKSLADRSYFRRVVATGRPYVSEAIVTRTKPIRRVIVTAVPTRDAKGRLSGVLTGGLLLRPSSSNAQTTDLGYTGLDIIDRAGQRLSLQSLAHPRNRTLVQELHRRTQGVLTDVEGLDGHGGHVVAFATSRAAGWTIVIDRPRSSVFASARRSFAVELGSIGVAGLLGLVLISWGRRWFRRQLRQERSRIRGWTVLTHSLNLAPDAEAVCEAVVAALVTQFPAALSAAMVTSESEDEPDRRRLARGHRSQFTQVDDAALARLVRSTAEDAGPAAIEDRDTLRRRVPELSASMRPAPGSLYTTSLVVDGLVVGAVGVVFAAERALPADDQAVIQAHADQGADALARIGRHQLEHDTAIVLQRSLLPSAPFATDGVEVAAHYRAGGPGVEVGGDWYDVVRRPDGIVHVTVGDVAGRGIPAAILMGQLRTAFSAYALDSTSPAELVERVGRHVVGDHMATMLCVAFDPLTHELTYASAGHPPPLLVDAETRRVSLLDRRGRPPLGWETRRPLFDTPHEVPDQATLVLYTDGLVERRDLEIDRGIELLAKIVGEPVEGSFDLSAGRIVDAIVGPGVSEDDAALMLVQLRPVPSRISIEFPGRASLLQELRRRLRVWTRLRGLDADQQQDAILAISEACNNAIEHGYREGEGTVKLELHHVGGALSIVVEDDGVWREPQQDPTRGRGFVIMNELMATTEVTQKPRGTRVALEQSLV